MAAEDLKAALKEVGDVAVKQFPRNRGRLHQLQAALATASMAIDHLVEEEIRHTDLAARVREAFERGEDSPHRHQLANLHPEYAKESK